MKNIAKKILNQISEKFSKFSDFFLILAKCQATLVQANWDELGPTSLKCFLDHFKSFETKKFSSKNFHIFYGILAKCEATLVEAN